MTISKAYAHEVPKVYAGSLVDISKKTSYISPDVLVVALSLIKLSDDDIFDGLLRAEIVDVLEVLIKSSHVLAISTKENK